MFNNTRYLYNRIYWLLRLREYLDTYPVNVFSKNYMAYIGTVNTLEHYEKVHPTVYKLAEQSRLARIVLG